MKLIIFIAACLILFSCDDSVKSTEITEKSYVEYGVADSTNWKPSRIYIPSREDQIYFIADNHTYKVYGNAPAEYIFCLIIGLIVGLIVGSKLTE